MYYEQDCYFCRYLCFFDAENVNGYVCTLKGLTYQKLKPNAGCEDFVPDIEE